MENSGTLVARQLARAFSPMRSTAVLLALSGATSAQCLLPDDPLEPNEYFCDGLPLGAGHYPGLTLVEPDHYRVYVPPGMTVGFVFDVEASSAGHLNAFIAHNPGPGQCYHGDWIPVAPGATGVVEWQNRTSAGRRILMRIHGTLDHCVEYDMTIRLGSHPCEIDGDVFAPNDDCASAATLAPGHHPDLRVSELQSDWFEIDVQPGEILLVDTFNEVDDARMHLALFDGCGGTLLHQSQHDHSAPEHHSAWWVNSGASSTTVMLRVGTSVPFGIHCHSYDMFVHRSSDPCQVSVDDPFEDNDTCWTPAPLALGVHTGLLVTGQDRDFFALEVPPHFYGTVHIAPARGELDLVARIRLPDTSVPTCGTPMFEQSVSAVDTIGLNNFSGELRIYTLEIDAGASMDDGHPIDCELYDLTWVLEPNPIGQNTCISTPNSTGQAAGLRVIGSEAVADDDLALVAFSLPAGEPTVFFFGDGAQQVPFGNGYLCVDDNGGGVHRAGMADSGNGESVVVFLPLSGSGGVLSAGSTWNFQAWYRDGASPAPSFNLTNGVQVTFQ